MNNNQLERNLEECREIGHRIFAEPWVGERTDIVYSPLQKTQLDPYSQYFLRMSSKFEQGRSSAGLEFVEHFQADGSEKVWLGYSVDDEDSISVDISPIPRLDGRKIDIPHVMHAPQINMCLNTILDSDRDVEIDPSMLLDEIKVISDANRVAPHVSTKITVGHPVDEYSIDCLHKVHRLPPDLAHAIHLRPRVMGLIDLTARYQGKITLKATMLFDLRGQLKGLSSNMAEDPVKQIDALASFKRAVLN